MLHDCPHLDELLALFLLREYGRHKFDLSSAKMAYFTIGVWPEGDGPQKHQDCLFVGCGGSQFDEHGKSGEETCSARLVANFLGLGQEKCFEELLDVVQHEDRNGACSVKDHIASVVKGMIFHAALAPEQVYEWLKPLFASIIKSEQECWDRICAEVNSFNLAPALAREEKNDMWLHDIKCPWLPFSLESGHRLIAEMIDEKFASEWLEKGKEGLSSKQHRFDEATQLIPKIGRTEEFESYRGPVKMLVIETDNTQVGPASRKLGYDLFIQKSSQGNVILMTNQKRNIWLNNVVALFREEEAQCRGVKVARRKLSKQGTIEEVPNWHLHEGAVNQLYNGTLTASAVEPTVISLERLVQLVQSGLRPRKPKDLVSVREAMAAS